MQPPAIAEILPAAVACAEERGDPEGAVLFPEEEPVVARAVEGRRRAFTTGRECARRALAELGLAPIAIPRDERGAPCWPAGIVGSITHCAGYRAAAVARTQEFAGVGIDAEPDAALSEGVLRRITRQEERALLRELASTDPAVSWDRLLFSAKESVYKTWYPLTGRWLGFHDARVELDAAGGFHAQLLVPGPVLAGVPLDGFAGRWLARDGLVLTAVALAA